MARFGRVLTAMVTPFGSDGALDLDAARRLARWLQDHGNDGLVVAGTTGESPVLTDDERLSLFAAVIEAVTIPVVAGTGTNDTSHSVHMTKEATRLGAAGILAVTPYYNRPSQAGIAGHMGAMADATDLPVVLYDIPVRSGRKINSATILELARRHRNVLALKDAAGSPGETASVIANASEGFEVYSGDDSLTLPLLSVGAVGVIGVATHWTGPDHQIMFDRWQAGDSVGARRVNQALLPSFAYETGDDAPNPIPSKVMMNHLGVPVGECRLPMGPAPDFVLERAKGVLAGLDARRAEGF
ncbi:MAG: 4-hydroxy-tetrahydrodipicolinate synthase [Actinomycetota bacterium]|jgi:4-hydroxy-tetrahydrodipicolinate synthase|nr:4-hydroxy-tetrahydrodipicolinate synthase [Actinomycetota bacterium]MDA3011471.1 4-hydroxy-tetrahydrodipicolinate synthase [Actinomycetota bacterium]MDA3024123.1 4-hydroxy-tetrahydrodipicolinate synthase [Actinomycetota bacterium]